MRKLLLSAVAAGAALVCLPAAAEQKPSASARSHHSDKLPAMLNLRLRSIELQIDMLSDREMIGREEANDLRAQARRLEERLHGLSAREAGDVELAVARLQAQLRFASDDARLGSYASRRRDLGRFDDGDRYGMDRDLDRDRDRDRDSYQRADPRGDPFLIWKERDERGPH